MRHKIIMIVAMLAMMVSMTGIAAAYDANIWNAAGTGAAVNPINLHRGGNINLSFHGEEIVASAINTDLPYSYKVVALATGSAVGAVGDVTVTLPANFHPTAATFTDIGAINVALSASAPIGAEYRVTIRGGDEEVDIDFGSASRNFNSIPEYATVGLPALALIGLVFFLQNRKNKKE
jgi:hypothetical protein